MHGLRTCLISIYVILFAIAIVMESKATLVLRILDFRDSQSWSSSEPGAGREELGDCPEFLIVL